MLEVYPHPAMVRLFNLEQIIKYKKGQVARKRSGLRELQARLSSLSEPGSGLKNSPELLKLLHANVESMRGAALKEYEDSLDALFCAFLAWHCWRWGAARNEMFGSLEQGYIVVPKRSPIRLRAAPHGC
jgi:predicted RNase H-like nuclease